MGADPFCLTLLELPAAGATQAVSKAQEKNSRGKRKRKKDDEHPKEERQEKGSRKNAGME